MSSKRDYYSVLDLPKNADSVAIKKSYRKLAMKYHPDVNKNDQQAEKKFKELNEAYEVLSDPDKKAHYDRFGHQGMQQQSGFGGGTSYQGNFEEMFGSGGGFGNIFEEFFGGGNVNRPRKGQDVIRQVEVTLEEAFYGKEIKIKMLDGEIKTYKIPRGVQNGMDIRIIGKGHPGSNGGPNGNYYIRVFVKQRANLERSKDDLVLTILVNVLDAISGKKIEFNLFRNETIKITIPQLSDFTKLLRVKGKGFVNINDHKIRGDLYIKMIPLMPRKLNRKSKEYLEKLKKEMKIK